MSRCSRCEALRTINSPRYDACECTAGSLAVELLQGLVCVPCAPAHIYANDRCVPCPPGSVLSLTKSDTCDACGPGTYAPTPASPTCIPCPAGSYASTGNQSQCSTCVWPAFASNANRTGCVPTAGLCRPAFYFNRSTQNCTACSVVAREHYRLTACTATEDTAQAACTSCGDKGGVAMQQDCGFDTDRICSVCAPAFFVSPNTTATVCSRCPRGSVAPLAHSSACSTCDAGLVASLNQTACVHYDSCGTGAYVDTFIIGKTYAQACAPCPASTYGPGDGGCYACTDRWAALTVGASVCTGCVPAIGSGLCTDESWATYSV